MTVFDIPVLFQVTAASEDIAADQVAGFLEGAFKVAQQGGFYHSIESWHMPNHKHIDRSDAPVRVAILHEGIDYATQTPQEKP